MLIGTLFIEVLITGIIDAAGVRTNGACQLQGWPPAETLIYPFGILLAAVIIPPPSRGGKPRP